MSNAVLKILDPNTTEHPILVVGGPNQNRGPVAVAPGTRHQRDDIQNRLFSVDPVDIQEGTGGGGTLEGTTYFLINQPIRIQQQHLRRKVGRLREPIYQAFRTKLAAIRRLGT